MFHPGLPHTAAASRRSPCAAATSRAPPRSRSVWSAPACWRFRSSALLPETYRPTFASQKRHGFLRTRRHTPLEAPIPPRPGGGVPEQVASASRQQGSACTAPSPAAAEVAGGRPKTQTRPRVGSFASRGCNSLSEQRFTFGRFVPVRAARTLKGNGFFVGFPVAGAQKVKCAGSGQRRGSPQLQLRRLAARRWATTLSTAKHSSGHGSHASAGCGSLALAREPDRLQGPTHPRRAPDKSGRAPPECSTLS